MIKLYKVGLICLIETRVWRIKRIGLDHVLFLIGTMLLTMISIFWGGFVFVGRSLILKWSFFIRVSRGLIVSLNLLRTTFASFILLPMRPTKAWIGSCFGSI